MRPHDQPHGLCCIDPLSALVGGIIPALAGGGGGNAPAATPAPAPAQPPPAQTPDSSKKPKPQQASFIGGVPTPPPSTGQKTLLGQ